MSASDARLTMVTRDQTVVLSGEVDAATAGLFDQWLNEHLDDSGLRLDLADVSFMDSSGLRVLIAHNEELAGNGAELVIVNPSTPVQRLFEITGLTDVLNVQTS